MSRSEKRQVLGTWTADAGAILWPTLAVLAATTPFLRGLVGQGVFYLRDLSIAFWGRYLWLRRAWLSGAWPLWDPYAGGGQPAYSDALNQYFLLPSLLARLVGGEAFGFNLWVAAPFPLAALGTYVFLKRHCSRPAAALGAMAFTLAGPIVSTGNFPNMSWAVAALPWMLWAVDALSLAPTPLRLAVFAITVALQALGGEMVTLFESLLLVVAFAAVFPDAGPRATFRAGIARTLLACLGIVLGLALSAVQLVPSAYAAMLGKRAALVAPDLWSLRPTALLETVWLHLFGNFFDVRFLTEIPWKSLLYTGREPLLLSLYFGTPLLALFVFGLASDAPRRWRMFWLASGFASLLAAFGAYTPIYPVFRDHVPIVGSLRFPIKYIVVAVMAVAAGAAVGWDALGSWVSGEGDARRRRRARLASIGFAGGVGILAGLAGLVFAFAPWLVARPLGEFAVALGAISGGPAVEFLVRTVPRGAVPVVCVSLGTAALLLARMARGRIPRTVGLALYLVVVGDLGLAARGLNPVMDAAYLAEPTWVAFTRSAPHARFYVGGKYEGSLDAGDRDASRGFIKDWGLDAPSSKAALNNQAVFTPAAWHVREMLSLDLAVLWPGPLSYAQERFRRSPGDRRERFLERTGVRYRILPARRAAGRTPLVSIPFFLESFLYDWGAEVAPRAAVVGEAREMPNTYQQILTLFEPGWDSRTTVFIERGIDAAGRPGDPVPSSVRFVDDSPNRVALEAGAGAEGGYLVLLDTYSPDWRVRVDGQPADMVRANGLFRAVRLVPGRHLVEFVYRPTSLFVGAAVTGIAMLVVAGLLIWPRGRKRRASPMSPSAPAASPRSPATP